jgi:hypothetical protein
MDTRTDSCVAGGRKSARDVSECVTGRAMAQVVSHRAPASHGGGPGSRSGQSMWDLWWKKWHWDRFFSEFFGFPVNIIPPSLSKLISSGECVMC